MVCSLCFPSITFLRLLELPLPWSFSGCHFLFTTNSNTAAWLLSRNHPRNKSTSPCPCIPTLASRSCQDKLQNPSNCLLISPWSRTYIYLRTSHPLQHHQTPHIPLWICAPFVEKNSRGQSFF
ncbi:hypothetical protein LDENG_00113140 [Lucifuga dentata]|nr:hypothetical protein LDENG_00113140 [Lucifuga dentata]